MYQISVGTVLKLLPLLPLVTIGDLEAWLAFLVQGLSVVKVLYSKPLSWWTKRQLQRKVRQVAHIASRGMGGFEDPNVSAVFVAPQRVTEIHVNPETNAFDIVQVNRDGELLLMQSSLQTLKGQFDYLKEYLPLDAVYALEFVQLYPSLVEVSPKAARNLRVAVEQYCRARPQLVPWHERFEALHTRGNIAGLIMPYLMDVHGKVPTPNRAVRRECANYILWVCRRINEIMAFESRPTSRIIPYFRSASLKLRIWIMAVGDRDWPSYGQAAVSFATHGCDRLILIAFGVYHAEKALQAAIALSTFLPGYSVSHIVVTSVAGKGQALAFYVYVETGRTRDNELALRKLWEQASSLDNSSVKSVQFDLARNGFCLVRHAGVAFLPFITALFDLMGNTDAQIAESSVWTEGAEPRVLLHISRLPRNISL